MKERVIYWEIFKRRKYVKLSAAITISSLHPDARIDRVELQARGFIESGASPTGQLEFYEVRIVIRPPG